ncbi:MAG: alpha-glucosidase/alpha-galactosidase [Clostridia bacterium]|nr:alpha-glucosidase/alpha-galactosidase [Clostridia bacterium]
MILTAKRIKVAYIGGGSKNWARWLIRDLAYENSFFGEFKLYDLDYESAVDNATLANMIYARQDVVGKHHFEAKQTLKETLNGVDFVIISILPGGFEEMRSDVHTPEKYGIYQSVGDTTGPGGILRAMRTIPIYKRFALAIKEYCPNAWVINYTNPMSMCVKALYEVFPAIKALGCCHEVFGTQKLLAKALYNQTGIEIPREEVKVSVSGINHFTWITKAEYQENDIFECYRKMVEDNYESGYDLTGTTDLDNNPFACLHKVKFDLFKRYGAIAAAGDRHLAEFCPGGWYLKNPDKVKEWKFNLTTVDYRIKESNALMKATKDFITGKEEFVLTPSGEEGVKILKAISGLGDLVSNCNLPNHGQMYGVEEGTIVETNAIFSADSVKPVVSGKLSGQILALVNRVAIAQTEVVRAILDEDYDRVFNCFVNDPLVTISLDQAKELFLDMIENTKHLIPRSEEYLKENGR